MMANESFNTTGLEQYINLHWPFVELALEENLPLAPAEIETGFNDAVRYLVFPGGKRLRPILTMLGAELFGGKAEEVMHAAAAVEYIHTSSMIFDDLPCMDDSIQRRRQPSLHEKYGEGLSILVAIGFLNHSYRLVTMDSSGDAGRAMDAVLEIVNCVGPAGMVGGQSLDITVFGKANYGPSAVRISSDMQNRKTSALIRLSLRLGGILAGADYQGLEQLSSFADCLGHAYQISDDVIDANEDESTTRMQSCKNGNRSTLSLKHDLMIAAEKSKSILTYHFAPSEARECLLELVDYIVLRKD